MRIATWIGSMCLVIQVAAMGSPQVDSPLTKQRGNSTAEADEAIVRRRLDALEKNPKRGLALESVYGWYVERGRLDELMKVYRVRTEKNASDSTAWMVLGLLEAHRGHDEAAVPAFREAERLRPTDALASYYLGHALILTGQNRLAVEAFERAIERKPANRNDLIEIYQALARVHQREQRMEEALKVWRRLEDQFPNELRIRERVTTALVEDGQYQLALERYQALVKDGTDRLRLPLYRASAAELKARLGRRDEALADLERLVDDLPPGEWLHRDARRRLEDLFLGRDDISGLAAYYANRVKTRPDDLDALVRLAHYLQAQGRTEEARHRLEDALKLAPGDAAIRRELAGLLAEHRDFAGAASQFEQIHKIDPTNPDVIREWGWLTLRVESSPEAERRKNAASIWRKLLPGPGRPPDPSLSERVADLLRQAGMTDEALALYREVVQIAPDSAGHRIHLGEFLNSLGRRDEARQAWRSIAAGPARNARNLRLLADTLADFDDRAEALAVLAEARQLDPADFGLALQQANLLARSSQYVEAARTLEAAAKLAANPEQAEEVLQSQIDVDLAGGTLARRAEVMAGDLGSGRETGSAAWYRLARYREAARQWPAAEAAIRKALEVPTGSRPVDLWAAEARIAEGSGRLADAADALRRVAELDRKARPEHLRQVATLETRLGRRDRALAAGRDLLIAAPSDSNAHLFHAQICLKLDARDEAIESLRNAVRIDANNPRALASLAEALVEAGRPEEAIELNWRAFDRAGDLIGKRTLVGVLAQLYLKINQFDRLIERLERLRRDSERDADARRTLTLCLAQAYQSVGELGTARGELERLLPDRPEDVSLLQQLVGLAEREGDLTAALRFQRQVAKVAPRDSQDHLVGLLLAVGEIDEALLLWEHDAGTAQGTRRLLELSDNLLFVGQTERALPTIRRILRDHPQDWEALYREGIALAALKQPEEAARRFQAILDLRLRDDQIGALIAPEASPIPGPAEASLLDFKDSDAEKAFLDRVNGETIGMINESIYPSTAGASTSQRKFWTPGDFGQARMASLAWLRSLAVKTRKTAAFTASLRERRGDAGIDPRGWWDSFYLNSVLSDRPACKEAAAALVKTGEPEAHWAYLNYFYDAPQPGTTVPAKPATDAELTQALASFRAIKARRPDWIDADLITPLLAALKNSKRQTEEEAIIRESVAGAFGAEQIVSLMQVAGDRGDVESLLRLFAGLDGRSWAVKSNRPFPQNPRAYPSFQVSHAFMAAVDARAEAGNFADVARLLEAYLDANRRRTRAAQALAGGVTPEPEDALGMKGFRVGTYLRTIDMGFPAPGFYLDSDVLTTLGDVFMLYERAEKLGDFASLLRARLGRTSGPDRSYELLALCGLHWWQGERTESLAALTQAVQASPEDPTLRLELARMHESVGQTEQALAVIDGLPAPDHAAVLFRESAALRVAVRSGNIARVRLAADRLFPLRIDAAAAAEIAGQMRQIGMPDRSSIILERARSQTGGNPIAMRSLMGQYQTLNRNDVAADLALQILRVTRVQSSKQPQARDANEKDIQLARSLALTMLAKSGQLNALIARTEAETLARPRSFALLDTLQEYYTTLADKAKLTEVLERKIRLRPDEPSLRYQHALGLVEDGRDSKAIEVISAALKADPSIYYRNGAAEVLPIFQRAGKVPELFGLLERDDSDVVDTYEITTLLRLALADPKLVDSGVRFLKASISKPAYVRGSLIDVLLGELSTHFLKLPEAEAIIHDEVFPRADSAIEDPWIGFGTSVGQVLAMAAERGKLVALTDELERVVKQRPDWSGGKAILALIDLRKGRIDRAREAIVPLIETKEPAMPATAVAVLVDQLEPIPELLDLAIRAAEFGAGVEGPTTSITSVNGVVSESSDSGSLSWKLIDLYQNSGRIADARATLMKMFKATLPRSKDTTAQAIRGLENQAARYSQKFLTLDDPLDALRVQFIIKERVGWGVEPTRNKSLDPTLKAVSNTPPRDLLEGLVPEDAKDGATAELMLMVHPSQLERIELKSVLDDAIRATPPNSPVLANLRERLDRLHLHDPKDLNVAIAEALAGLPTALDRLDRLVAERPLDELPSGAKSTLRQRTEAAPQISLWLVARACLRRPETRAVGLRLGERALASSRIQLDPVWSLAILREWGQIERQLGNHASARARWSEMIGLVNDRARLRSKAGPSPASGSAPLLPDHSQQLLDIATLAARQGDVELSLSATVEALRNGPPAAAASTARFTYSRGSLSEGVVAARLVELDRLWREKQASPDQVYQALCVIVLPEARPEEVFPYLVDIKGIDNSFGSKKFRPGNAGRLLAEWAARVGRSDELIRAVESRQARPLAEVPARIVLAEIGRTRGTPGLTLQQIEWFDRRLDNDGGLYATTSAAHVALGALDRPDTSSRALALLNHMIGVTNSVNSTAVPWLFSLQEELARAQLVANDLENARKNLGEALKGSLARYQNDVSTSLYFRKSGIRKIIGLYVAAGRAELAWDDLGQLADLENGDVSQMFMSFDVEQMFDSLARKPAVQRYDFLKAWVVPSDPQKPLRLISVAAGAAASTLASESGSGATERALLNTFGLLIDAARQSDRLDDLAGWLKPLADANRPNANALALMVAIARGQSGEVASRVREFAAKLATELQQPAVTVASPFSFSNGMPPVRLADGLLALACLGQAELRPIGQEMANRLISSAPAASQSTLHGRLRLVSTGFEVARRAGVDRSDVDLNLRFWRDEATPRSGSSLEGWVGSEGHLLLIPGSAPRPLRLNLALGGTFEFRCEASEGSRIDYGGLSFAPLPTSLVVPIRPLIRPAKPGPPENSEPRPPEVQFHAYRLVVAPGTIQCWIDGRLIYESTDLARSFPWLTLLPGEASGGPVVFRNLRLTGTPEILREIPLASGKSTRWSAESAEPLGRLGARNPFLPEPDVDSFRYSSSFDTASKLWVFGDDSIEGAASAPETLPVWFQRNSLSYDRELRDGESIRYEFFHQAGAVAVEPTLGRKLFRIEEGRVTTYLLEPGGDAMIAETTPPQPGNEVGPVRLKVGDWNSVGLSIRGGSAELELNNQVIARQPIGPRDGSNFGLSFDRDRNSWRVRGIKLVLVETTLNPGALLLSDLTVPASSSPVSERIRRAWIGEDILTRNARAVLNQARALPPTARFEVLRGWVLPDEGTALPRLAGEFPPDDRVGPSNPPLGQVPAFELVELARSLGKLDELAAYHRKAAGADGPEHDAFEALIGLARGQDAAISASLIRLRSRLERAPVNGVRPGWPEFVAGRASLERASTREEASKLLEVAVARLDPSEDANPVLSLQLRHAAGLARLGGPPVEPPICTPRLSHWLPSTQETSRTIGLGLPRPFWTVRDGLIRHDPGRGDDTLTFASPLRGDFELRCEIAANPDQAVRVEYAGLGVELAKDGKSCMVLLASAPPWASPIDPPLAPGKDWLPYRLSVHAGRAEIIVDGRVLFEGRIPIGADPWLVLHGPAKQACAIRNLTLAGRPEIPDHLDLAAGTTLPDWSVAEFDESTNPSNSPWRKVGGEILGRASPLKLGRNQESVLRYRRPLADRDVVEYEFDSRAGRSMVHPALGSLVFLIEADGIRPYKLTHTVSKLDGPIADPRADDPSSRRGPQPIPLRDREWNSLRLALDGDTLTLQLNKVEVYRTTLSHDDSRIFGFFHDPDLTEAHVRAVRLQGAWPLTLTDPASLLATDPANR